MKYCNHSWAAEKDYAEDSISGCPVLGKYRTVGIASAQAIHCVCLCAEQLTRLVVVSLPLHSRCQYFCPYSCPRSGAAGGAPFSTFSPRMLEFHLVDCHLTELQRFQSLLVYCEPRATCLLRDHDAHQPRDDAHGVAEGARTSADGDPMEGTDEAGTTGRRGPMGVALIPLQGRMNEADLSDAVATELKRRAAEAEKADK